jgi:carbonic anhydrase/acetyltransferase-like protein (isoleucine patch superfamily)
MTAPLLRAYRGKRPVLGREIFVAPTAVVIGDVVLGDEASLWFGTILRGDVGSIRVGKRTNIQDLSIVHVTGGEADTVIGEEVTVGHRVVVHGCTIEDGALVGMGSVLLDGCVIGEGSVVGAGAVVPPGTKIPPRSLVLGVPARVVRPATDAEARLGRDGAERYVALAARYRSEE